MPANKNALIRYKTIDNCLRNRYRRWTLDDLVEACSDALYDMEGITKGVCARTVQMDIQIMRSDKLGYNAPFKQNCLKRSLSYVELQVGFGPTTCSLQVSCTTTVLLKHLGVWWGSNPWPPEPQPGTLPTELQTPYKLQMDFSENRLTLGIIQASLASALAEGDFEPSEPFGSAR